jgi:hypothetical protein
MSPRPTATPRVWAKIASASAGEWTSGSYDYRRKRQERPISITASTENESAMRLLAMQPERRSSIRRAFRSVKNGRRDLRIVPLINKMRDRRLSSPAAHHTHHPSGYFFLAPNVKPSPVVRITSLFLLPGTGWLTYWSRKFAFAVIHPFNFVAMPKVKFTR